MPRHDSKGQRFLLQGPIEEVGEDSIVRDHDDDGTWELVNELEQILSSSQPALPSPSYFDDYDEAPFAPGEVVQESYNPYDQDESYEDEEDEYYETEEDGIEAVDYWVPAYRGPSEIQPRLTGPAPVAEPPPPQIWPRRLAYIAGFGAIFLVAAAGAYFAFQLSDEQPTATAVAVAEPVVAAEPAPVIVNVERIDPRVIDAPAVADEAAAPVAAAPEPLVAFVEEPRVPALVAAPTPAAETPVAPAPAAETPVAAVAAPEPPAPLEPVVTNGPVTEQGVTTAWVNLRTGPSNAYGVISVLAAGAEIGIVACDRWCEVEADGRRGWIHGDFVTTAVTTPDAVVAEAGAGPVAVAVEAGPFTANVNGAAAIYDSPFEDGAVAVTIRSGGEILIVGCDINWCETRFGDASRRGWIDRRQVRIPDTITADAIPPLPPITREQAAALKAAAI